MKNSLQHKLLYSYMAVVIVVLASVSVGVSVIIREYFMASKRQELINKGNELSRIITDYYQDSIDYVQLSNFVNSVDSFLDARVWVIDNSRRIVAISTPRRAAGFGKGHGMGRGSNTGMGMGFALLGRMHYFSQELDKIFQGHILAKTYYHPYYNENMLIVAVPLRKGGGDIVGAVMLNAPAKGIDDFLQRIYYYIGATGLIAIILTVIIVNWLSRGIVRPLKAMQQNAGLMARGDYSTRVKVETEDEVGDLGRSLNALAHDLENFVRQAEKIEKLRRDFVANVSHELRTPLTIIRGYTEALLDGTISQSDTAGKYYQLMRDETVRLERLIKELLDLSRLQADNAVADMELIPLGDIADSVIIMLRQKAEQKGILLKKEFVGKINIVGNGDRLTQLLLILTDNALKFTPSGGEVTVTIEALNSEVVITVQDTGQGIPEADLPYIWERFYKGDKSHSRAEAGTGLGLAIAKEIIEMHKGQVEVSSEFGKGTSFILRFPAPAG